MRRVAGLVVAEVLAVAVLHKLPLRLPSGDMTGWLDSGPPDVLVMGALRAIGLVLAYWMLATTVAYLLARLARIPGAIAAIEWATLPAIRRIADRAAATVLAVSIAAPAAVLMAPPSLRTAPPVVTVGPIVVITDEGTILPPGASVTDEPADGSPAYVPRVDGEVNEHAGSPEDGETEAIAAAPDRTPLASTASVTGDYTVRRGDNLWTISREYLSSATGRRDLSESEIATFWAKVVAANRSLIRSGNPDYIYPGEIIVLPEIET